MAATPLCRYCGNPVPPSRPRVQPRTICQRDQCRHDAQKSYRYAHRDHRRRKRISAGDGSVTCELCGRQTPVENPNHPSTFAPRVLRSSPTATILRGAPLGPNRRENGDDPGDSSAIRRAGALGWFGGHRPHRGRRLRYGGRVGVLGGPPRTGTSVCSPWCSACSFWWPGGARWAPWWPSRAPCCAGC